MEIKFVGPYKSIQERFNDVNAPDFCVLVGKNGSGKTHILKAIQDSHVTVNNISKGKIIYFNFQSFLIGNQRQVTPRNIEKEKQQAWNIINSWQTNSASLRDDEASIKNHIESQKREDKKRGQLLESGINRPGRKLSELDQKTFMAYAEYTPDDYELLDSLSEICFDYRKKYILAQLSKELGGEEKGPEELKTMEENSPWHFINEMFGAFGLPHKIKSPDFNAADIMNNGNLTYQTKPLFEGSEIEFQDLSSGERILCALALTVFQDQKDTTYPEALLLDEIDASLHPSIIKNLLSVIGEVFLKNNCKVILATHSPTTAALVPEDSIFEVRPGKTSDKIVKISQAQAVEILSEGLMSLEKGLMLFDQISSKPLSIITEGDNVEHLKKGIEMLKPELLAKVDILKGIEGSSGKEQLKTLFDFFKLAPHSNKVLFVLDCDVSVSSRTDGNDTFIMSLPKNVSNTLTEKGIENMYPESLFDGFINTNSESGGTITKKFDPKRKKDFTAKVIASTLQGDFQNYQSLIDKMTTILGV